MAQGPLVAVPRELAQRKPAHGSKCNSCGLCCWSSKCDVGRALFGADGARCPALRFDAQGNSSCDVLVNTGDYTTHNIDEARAALALLLFVGYGCTMRINGEMNAAFNNRLHDHERFNRAMFDLAMAIWKLPPREDDLPLAF